MSTAFLEALIDYCLIIIFFLGVAGMVMLLSKHTREESLVPAEKQFQAHKPDRAAYALLGGLFLLFFVLTFSVSRKHGHHPHCCVKTSPCRRDYCR
jgi:hypothetical protein